MRLAFQCPVMTLFPTKGRLGAFPKAEAERSAGGFLPSSALLSPQLFIRYWRAKKENAVGTGVFRQQTWAPDD